MNIRFPNIQGDTAAQLAGIKNYLYQLTQELNFALEAVEEGKGLSMAASQPRNDSPEETFHQVKGLIIKSADIVNAYYDAISRRLEGQYVATSDFGEFSEKTAGEITATATGLSQKYENLQTILTQLGQTVTGVQAYINTGLLYYDDTGAPVYGMEIGQQTDGVFRKFARFTADKLAFYDAAGGEVAYISDRKLRIPHAVVEQSLTRGGYEDTVENDGSITTRWVGV